MPFKDPIKRKQYYDEYNRKRRLQKRDVHPVTVQPISDHDPMTLNEAITSLSEVRSLLNRTMKEVEECTGEAPLLNKARTIFKGIEVTLKVIETADYQREIINLWNRIREIELEPMKQSTRIRIYSNPNVGDECADFT